MTQQSSDNPVVILASARTAMGAFQGGFSSISATDLGAAAIKAAVERAGIVAELVERAYMGCVLPAGVGQAPARQAAIKAGLPTSTGATTISKVCGSGMQAVIMGADTLLAGSASLLVAGGMESMTNAPYLLKKHRSGARAGHDTVHDHMFLDGLEDAYEGKSMGSYAQQAADAYQLTREMQDDFAITSLARANAAIENGAFSNEITPVAVPTRTGQEMVTTDEQPLRGNPDKIRKLRPAFSENGTITAASSSSISDGAAALVLTRQATADRLQAKPVARIVATAAHARKPSEFTIAPVDAIRKVLDKAGWSIEDVDLFEINEAFACVTMIAMHDLGLEHEKVNVLGGATALGHPIGASGARIICTLINALQLRGGKRGVASLCIGGGEATAIALELIG